MWRFAGRLFRLPQSSWRQLCRVPEGAERHGLDEPILTSANESFEIAMACHIVLAKTPPIRLNRRCWR